MITLNRLWAAATLAILLLAVVPSRAHDEFRFIGVVMKMDTAKNRLTVKFKENAKDETVEMAITPKTEITRDKKKVAKSELKAGVNVVVDALGDDYDSLEALMVRIVPPPSK